jgi:uncharacterized protein (TIGR02594 family)
MASDMTEIQRALAARGYNPGAIDGAFGPRTREAVRAFQRANGLADDGVPGPLTLAVLLNLDVVALDLDNPALVWFQQARRLMGLREVEGPGSNPAIMQMAEQLDVFYANDDWPWCGLFTGYCIQTTLADEAVPSDLLRAQAWKRFGTPIEPTPGAVMVFWRETPESGLGHVGFYAGEDDSHYRILGGNQSNSVTLKWYPKDRFLAARWPATVAQPPPRPVRIDGDHKQVAPRWE